MADALRGSIHTSHSLLEALPPPPSPELKMGLQPRGLEVSGRALTLLPHPGSFNTPHPALTGQFLETYLTGARGHEEGSLWRKKAWQRVSKGNAGRLRV